MKPRKPVVFFAIPCGHFYATQGRVIAEVGEALGIDVVIAEDDRETKGLWDKIAEQIRSADRFVADISSGSLNIALELGWALEQKGESNVAIFNSNVAADPSDLRGFVLQKYSSLRDFRAKLVEWLGTALPGLDMAAGLENDIPARAFQDDFRDRDRFLREWITPPDAAYFLTSEGLQFTNAHYPIVTSSLGLLRDIEFEFTARIDQKQIGWIVKGTRDPRLPIPAFCVMFALNSEHILTPHILSIVVSPGPTSGYHVYSDKAVKAQLASQDGGWITILTRVTGDRIEISNDGKTIVDLDMSDKPFGKVYNAVPHKEGQVGFRCFPQEIATVAHVLVRDLPPAT